MASRYLEPYNPRAYVPGGSSAKKARSIQTQGRIVPVPKPKNPYTRPTPGGGSSSTSAAAPSFSPASLMGASAQAQRSRVATPQFTFTTNYESDPVLARIKAIGTQTVNNAEIEAGKLRKQAVNDTGLTDIGREIGLDENTLQAAQGNPTSLLASLNRDAQMRSRDLDESLNQENLFWSGARANRLGELATGRAEAEAALTRDLRAALAGIDSGLLEARAGQALREQEELERVAAQQREQQLLDAIAAASGGTTVESGMGGNIGGTSYAAGPTPEQVAGMQSSGIDPLTAVFAPQVDMIHGPNNVPSLPTVGMPSLVGATDVIPPAGFNMGSNPRSLMMGGYVDPEDPYGMDNLNMQLALAAQLGYF